MVKISDPDSLVRNVVANNVATLVDGMEALGLRRDLVLDGMEQAIKKLRDEISGNRN